ncbi:MULTISPECIES: sigma factor-like helix-turn-helix DNA-binding protein [Thermocrispum]|uniref:Sigma factor-like helix-turn-helix DNA-binding protein n=1 Tax=Thermocrispum agreste TaxID=37925 RepID=A0ABD6FLY3_9PSEU
MSETAEVLGCSEGNVKSQQSRALTRLREVLDRMESTPSLARRAS